jgi:site-specific DNA-methyltransferase (adenine-specific)
VPTVDLRLGDCLTLLDGLPHVDAVITDPPYGANHDTKYSRFTGGLSDVRTDHSPIEGDAQPFDPSPWIGFPKVVLFGANCYSDKLPLGSWLVWCKKRDNQLGTFLSDAEVAWMRGGYGVYLYRHIWNGFDRETERRIKPLHPSQKPVALMRWVIERQRLPQGATILDPYMGVGATGVAAIELGYNFVGCEIEPTYFQIATERIRKAQEAHKQLELAV